MPLQRPHLHHTFQLLLLWLQAGHQPAMDDDTANRARRLVMALWQRDMPKIQHHRPVADVLEIFNGKDVCEIFGAGIATFPLEVPVRR